MKRISSKKAKAKSKPRQNSNLDPPQLMAQPVFNRTLRFINSQSGTRDIPLNSLDLFAALGCISLGGSSANCIAYTAKVKRISIWCTPKSDSDGAWQNVAIDWSNSTSFSSNKKVSDASISNARPAHVSSKPPLESVCNFWLQGTSVQYATITCPLGAIVDINVSFTTCDSKGVHTQTIQGVQPLGTFFYGYLDESTRSVGFGLQPVDLPF